MHVGQSYSRQGFEAMVMTFDRFHTTVSGVASVAIHLKRNMLRNATLLESTDKNIS